MPRLIPIFVNPFSGAGRNREQVRQLARTLREHHQLDSRIVDSLETRRQLLADPALPDRCPCIVVAGGDGTAASVIDELPEASLAKLPVAIMSVGNENLLARELNLLHALPDTLAGVIAAGHVRTFDLGLLTRDDGSSRRFVLMASAGLDSHVVGRVEAWRKLPTGLRRATRLSYLKPILAGLLGYHYPPLQLTADGQRFEGTHVFIMNINRYAGGLCFAPHACSDDGKLDYLLLEKPGRLAALRYLFLVASGCHLNRNGIHAGCAQSLRIEAATPLPIQADGDTIAHTPVTLSILPRSLKLIAPA